MEQLNYIDFKITEDQAKLICKYWNKDYTKLEDYEICELLDKTIDELQEEIIDNHIPHID